jgi:hypothetical protein
MYLTLLVLVFGLGSLALACFQTYWFTREEFLAKDSQGQVIRNKYAWKWGGTVVLTAALASLFLIMAGVHASQTGLIKEHRGTPAVIPQPRQRSFQPVLPL